MLHAVKFPRSTPSFIQRSSSVASLVNWKNRFEAGMAGKFSKGATFVSYMDLTSHPKFLANEDDTPAVQYVPENDLPPSYLELEHEFTPDENRDKNVSFTQDFTALEGYLKRKLSIRNRHARETHERSNDMEYETEQVFRWLNELPEGNNLEEFLQAYGLPTEHVDMEELKDRLKTFLTEKLNKNLPENESEEGIGRNNVPKWKHQITSLEQLAYDDNLENWIESLDVPYFRPLPETKDEIRKYLKLQMGNNLIDPPLPPSESIPDDNAAFTPKWKELVEKMKDLKNEEELDKWLESLDVPCNLPKDKVKAELKKFFMHETFETFTGKSYVLQDHTLAKELWEKFENTGVLKQVAMIAGTTAVLGLVAVLSTTMLSFAFPAAFSVSPYFNEVFAQYFLQRQEVAFNLLNFHAQNAKPLSTAWAKQYILWKYC